MHWIVALSIMLAGVQALAQPISLELLLPKKWFDPKKTGVYAAWVDTQQPIIALNAETPLNPASTAKLLTSFCALKMLGPQYEITTDFYSSQPPAGGVIPNLSVVGHGDTAFVSESLWVSTEQLKVAGVQKIDGDIIIDARFFDSGEYPGRQENNERAYNSLLSATSLNFNSAASYTIRPGENALVTYRSVAQPEIAFGQGLKTMLKQSGVSITGTVKTGKVPPGGYLLYKHHSKPLALLVRDINKFSNNFATEQIVKHLGAQKLGPPGSTKKGLEVIANCLQEIGIPPTSYHLENGSGLSIASRITPAQLVSVLIAASQNFSLAPEFISALSLYGADGTMKKRNHFENLGGQMRAKTGSLNGISTLAGYIQTENGRIIAFAILMNGLKTDLVRAQKTQDEITARLQKMK